MSAKRGKKGKKLQTDNFSSVGVTWRGIQRGVGQNGGGREVRRQAT